MVWSNRLLCSLAVCGAKGSPQRHCTWPSNDGNEHCVDVVMSSAHIDDETCSNPFPPLCEPPM
ncbi:MAG: hypothetical protein KC731_14165 [Myxococcales bacterium]|nr:hypothetical protein [Myxococcales bacterium]